MSDSPSVTSLQLKTIEHPGWLESHVTLQGAISPSEFQRALDQLPGGADATILGVDLFGTGAEIAEMAEVVARAGIAAPITSVISSAAGCRSRATRCSRRRPTAR